MTSVRNEYPTMRRTICCCLFRTIATMFPFHDLAIPWLTLATDARCVNVSRGRRPRHVIRRQAVQDMERNYSPVGKRRHSFRPYTAPCTGPLRRASTSVQGELGYMHI